MSHVSDFLRWSWVKRPAHIARVYTRYVSAFGSMFSLVFLIRTFAAPWKSIKDEYPRKGFNLNVILETLTLNITARVIGMVVRTGAMITGFIIQLFLFVGFAVYRLLWIFFPLLIVVGALLILRIF